MSENETGAPHDPSGHGHKVAAEVDNKMVQIAPGEYTVEELKKLFEIPAAKVLAIRIHSGFTLLADEAKVHIKVGGEVFLSHTRRGGSSCR